MVTVTDGETDAPVDELSSLPLRAEQLQPILETDTVSEVWIKNEGPIFKFWIEYTDRYQAVEYGTDSSGSGPAWNASVPIEKGEGELGEIRKEILTEEDWLRVSEVLLGSFSE